MPLIADQEIPIFIYIPLYPQLPSEVHAGQPEEKVQVRVKIYLGPKRLYHGDNPGRKLSTCNRLEVLHEDRDFLLSLHLYPEYVIINENEF